MNEFQFRDMVQFLNGKFEETAKPREVWTKNTIANLPSIRKEDGIWATKDILTGDTEKAVIIVGASPSLEEDVQHLKGLNDNFITIVVNSALKRVLKEGITPTYVIMIDGNDKDMVKHLDVEGTENMTLITCNAASHKAVKRWKGKKIWLPYYAIDEALRPKIRRLLGRQSPMGGNAFSCALSIAYDVWSARMFIFVANELCYDKRYYVDKKSKWDKKNVMHFWVKDITGRDRLTNIPLYQYKMWMEKMIDELPQCTFIDTSYGALGTDCKNLQHMALPEAIGRVNDAFGMKQKVADDWRLKEQYRYDAAYQSGTYVPLTGMESWKNILKMYEELPFKDARSILDVGCGFGQGIAMCRNRGLEAWGIDISTALAPYWAQANITKFCKVASADTIPFDDSSIDLVACFDILEHIPEPAVPDVLKEIRRVTKQWVIMNISIIPAVNKMLDGTEPHVCIKPIDWWIEQIKKSGMAVSAYRMANNQSALMILATKEGKYAGSDVPCDNLHVQSERKVRGRQGDTEVQGSDRLPRKRNDSVLRV